MRRGTGVESREWASKAIFAENMMCYLHAFRVIGIRFGRIVPLVVSNEASKKY
jgi:hypothetical protein